MSIRPNSRRLTLLLFCAVVTTPTRAQEDRAVERVLFNGNSYVYYNNLPGLVEAIAAGLNGPQLQIESHTHGGFTLQRHLDDGHAEELIRRGDSDGEPWTAVILQEQSSLGGRGRSGVLAGRDEFFAAVMQLDSLIDAAGSDLYLYMTRRSGRDLRSSGKQSPRDPFVEKQQRNLIVLHERLWPQGILMGHII